MRSRAGSIGLSRRGALAGITAAAAAGGARAQSRLPHVAVLSWYSSGDAVLLKALVDELARLGWNDGQQMKLEFHWAGGDRARADALAADLVRRGVDLIVARATPAALAAKRATSTVPIVFAPSADPIATGLVANLGRPGANITGVTTMSTELAAKRLEVLRELMPGLQRIAFLGVTDDPNAPVFARQTQAAAHAVGVKDRSLFVTGPDGFGAAFAELAAWGAQAAIAQPIFIEQRQRLAALARGHRIALVGDQREFALAGALLALGANIPAYLRRVARTVDRILKGAKPGDLPIEQPDQFDLAINQSTARALGLDVSDALLARADEVIE
jgi:putative tryptophan/tyrosine transport system substrate-binding protein